LHAHLCIFGTVDLGLASERLSRFNSGGYDIVGGKRFAATVERMNEQKLVRVP
jgi:hypothetical protein